MIDSMHHCADWRHLGSLGLSIPAEKSDTAAVWNPETVGQSAVIFNPIYQN